MTVSRDMFLDTCYTDPSQPPSILLLGNKMDIEASAKKKPVPLYFPVSPKTGDGIARAMERFLALLPYTFTPK
jgi:hypothetical protein